MTKEEERLAQDKKARQVYDLRVFVVGGGFAYLKMFHDAGFSGARSVQDADIICFTGGEDVNPQLYGEKALPETYFNAKRDDYEAYVFGECLGLEKPMIGICRGAQFLNVMNGGKLWQDVNNHALDGGHQILDLKSGEMRFNMTSTHHQQMIEGKDACVLALAALSTYKKSESQEIHREQPEQDDAEVIWYPDSLSLCFQPHPEFQNGECRNYFLDLVDEYILPAC